MYRDYDEERDDELYHYGKTGMKWGHHIYAMAKATAKKAARSASKNLKTGTKFLKDNPQFAYGVALPAAAFTGRATYQAVKKHNRIKRQEKQEKAKRTRIYDRSSGNYWHLKKELTNKQWLEVNKRKKAGEKTGDILKSMNDPKTTALALAGSSAVAGVLAYAASKTLESRRRKKDLAKVRELFGGIEGAYD